jgi:hypothetical protein
MFGYPNLQVVAATAAKYGFKTKNALLNCSNCAISKSKQKNLNNLTAHCPRNCDVELTSIFPESRAPVLVDKFYGF